MMPDTPLAFRDRGGGSLLPTQKLMHVLLGLAYKVLFQLQNLITAFHLILQKYPQNKNKYSKSKFTQHL